jgi:hypothetical protein
VAENNQDKTFLAFIATPPEGSGIGADDECSKMLARQKRAVKQSFRGSPGKIYNVAKLELFRSASQAGFGARRRRFGQESIQANEPALQTRASRHVGVIAALDGGSTGLLG